MVRVLCKPYSLPGCIERNKASEIIDSDQARRATQALQVQPNLTVHGDYPITSPPRCQSETDMSCDSDGDSLSSCSGGQSSIPMDERRAEVIQRRKERRRERNKLSAQAYRQRKREETQNQDKVVTDLEEQQKRLQEQVAKLEHEKVCVETFLRNCFHSVPWPVRNNDNNNNANMEQNTQMHCWHLKKHGDQVNGNMAVVPGCGTASARQEQNTMSVSNQMVVS
ncbi:hypothetical protein SNE40_008975 [Patella caerulea]|uniref:BZIP domain-containing protein n=1 Tax=Patella caerulea TaxID=87958 RepID=A0AAN8PX62_PATCE